MFERFTTQARRVVVLAQEESRRTKHPYIGTEHLLLGLLAAEGTPGQRTLAELGVTLEGARAAVAAEVPAGAAAPTSHIPFNPRAKKVLELSLREALRLQHHEIGSTHIGLGIVREGEGLAAKLLTGSLGVDLDAWRDLLVDAAAEETAPRPPRVRRITELFRPHPRRSPAVVEILGAAEEVAGDDPVASHHLLIAALRDPDSAAAKALAAQGLDPAALADSLAETSTEGTSDEPPAHAAARRSTLEVDGGAVVLRIDDDSLTVQAAAVIERWREAGHPPLLAGARPEALEAFAGLVTAVSSALEAVGDPPPAGS